MTSSVDLPAFMSATRSRSDCKLIDRFGFDGSV